MLNILQSYIAAGLSKIGLYDKKAAKIGLRRINPDDIFVVSFPKSGNTWVRFILANMLEGDKEITLQNINEYVPGIHNFKREINKREGRRFIKSHDPFFDCYPKTVYVFRDYRDVVISYYHYLIGHKLFEGSISEFIRSDKLQTNFGTWQNHVNAALKKKKDSPDSILFIGFDELKRQPIETLKKMAEFCEVTPKRTFDEVMKLCAFENLKETEQKHGKVFSSSKIDFFRSGESGQWKTVFESEDLEFLMSDEVRRLLAKLNLNE